MSGLLRKGDRVVAAQGSVGDMMWPKNTIPGLQSAVRTRVSSQSIRLRFERTVNLGAWEEQSREKFPVDKTRGIPDCHNMNSETSCLTLCNRFQAL